MRDNATSQCIVSEACSSDAKEKTEEYKNNNGRHIEELDDHSILSGF